MITHREVSLKRRSQRGQTLIMAILILGVLLVLGLVFIGIISRNITSAGRTAQRAVASDLADAGIKFAHSQLLNSGSGADWTPTLALPIGYVDANTRGRDPDVDLLRPDEDGAGPDRGGPDGLGAYSRVFYNTGRALIRVRYAPSDPSIFTGLSAGALREPGKARNYLLLESYGRPGRVAANDPTTLQGADRRESRKQIAFCSIGFIESARFITDKHQTSRAAEIGVPLELGARYDTQAVNVPIQIGDRYTGPGNSTILGGGSIYSNTDLLIHGTYRTRLNATYGDRFDVAGTVQGADDNARLQIEKYAGTNPVSTNFNLGNQTSPSLDSRSANYSTLGGIFRDGQAKTDTDLWSRHVGRKEPPSVMRVDPQNNVNRYVAITRDSGAQVQGGNNGRWGHGRNVFVNNSADLQMRSTEEARGDQGSNESLFYDWLNPNNGQTNSGWQGPFYVPLGSYLQLDALGFTIARDGRAPNNQRTWRRPDGSDSGLSVIRYRVGTFNGRLYIVNSLTPGVNINAANPGFQNGVPFDGVLYFEGNVRVRGVIPTDVQLTVVSMGNIYIEGSITKGIVDLNGNRLNRRSASMLGLLAKDYVVLNTTQFFGPTIGQPLEEVSETPGTLAYNPVRMRTPNGAMNLRTEMLLDPTSGLNPTVWSPFAQTYRTFVNSNSNSGPQMDTQLLVTHSMDDGPAPNSFFNLDINLGLGPSSSYNFALTQSNSATPFFPNGTNYAPIYGLGGESWQRYAKFESISWPVIHPTQVTVGPNTMASTANEGNYTFLLGDSSLFTWRPTNIGFGSTNDYVMARAAIVPHDVRIEAAIYAEEGCFFVIPGQWFNPNPNDRRDTYLSLGTNQAERDQARLDNYGAFPSTPFYGEPLDVRVQVIGSVAENMPPPISQQAEWIKKWGWIPKEHGASGQLIPWVHVPEGFDPLNTDNYVPNLTVVYDTSLATARLGGFEDSPANPYIRVDAGGRPLPPLPRLPVSPTLAYFGEVN